MDRLRRTRFGIALESVLAVLLLLPAVGHTQIAPTDEYSKLIAAGQSIQPMGTHPFGENVNLYNGSLSFEVTDVSVPGIGPVVQLSRSLDDADPTDDGFDRERPFGEWHLDIPRMETMTAFQGDPAGNGADVLGWWVYVSAYPNHLDRCTQFRAPPPAQALQDVNFHWDPTDWWYGYFLIVPGEGSQYVGSGFASTINGVSYTLGTKQNWRIACGLTASDGGEGFLAIAPDGTRYTFNHLIYRPATSLERTDPLPPGDGGEGPMDVLTRRDGLMYVTKIEDRFGNTLTYNWSSNDPGDPVNNHLTSIVASDGRELDLAYYPGTPLIQTVTVKAAAGASARTWTYYYDTSGNEPSLTKVQLPDGSAWIYQLGNLYKYSLQTDGFACPSNGSGATSIGASGGAGSVTAPSGLMAAFTVTPMFHGRSYVRQTCNIDIPGSDPQQHFSITPDLYGQFSLTKEVLSGPGIPTATWTWSYSPPNASWTTDSCASSKTCPTTVYTDVTDPLGHDTRYTYSNRFDFTEGQLLRTDSYNGAAGSTDLRSVVDAYANPSGQPWPTAGDIDVANVNFPQIDETSPLQNSVITQDGATFTTVVNAFDSYARVTSETGNNTTGGWTKTTVTNYHDDTNLWVLGQIAKVTVNSIAAEQDDYDSLDRPVHNWKFDKLISTNAWNGDGTLASVTDGAGNRTTFSNWYRGLPGKITFADNTSQSTAINGDGWITALTDENGFTTNYTYDSMGRLASVSYPSGDDVAWNQTLLSFAPVAGSEYGIPAGHWKQTVHTGNGYAVTYFDAFWRPLVTEHYDAGNKAATLSQTVDGYDAAGRRTFVSYPTASATSYTQSLPGAHSSYDALDRVTEVDQDSELGTLKTITAYISGFRTQVTDPRGYVTTTSYVAFGEPDTSYPFAIVAPEGETTYISRDVFDKPAKIIRTGPYNGSTLMMTRYYVYDANQQLCKRIDPESDATAMAYDAAGNLQWSAAGLNLPSTTSCDTSTSYGSGRRVDRGYDARNRLVVLAFPDDNGDQTWSYTADGLPAQVVTTNSGNTITNNYFYDKRRLMTREQLLGPIDRQGSNAGNFVWSDNYGHDANGFLSSSYNPMGTTISYAPNALGQPTRAGNYATGASYYPNGALKQFTYGNGIVHTMTENVRGLPSRLTDSGAQGQPASLDSIYSYDADGNVSAVNDMARTNFDRSMTYDGLDRLIGFFSGAVSFGGQYNLNYDPLDNLRSYAHVGGSTSTYNYDSQNRLASINNTAHGTIAYSWDVQGNLASDAGYSYQFDYGNRLRQAPGSESYMYDAYGRRVEQVGVVLPTIFRQYTYTGQLGFESDERNGAQRQYVYLGSQLVAIQDYTHNSVAYQTTDALGSVVAQTNADAWVDHFNYYQPWGALQSGSLSDGPGSTRVKCTTPIRACRTPSSGTMIPRSRCS